MGDIFCCKTGDELGQAVQATTKQSRLRHNEEPPALPSQLGKPPSWWAARGRKEDVLNFPPGNRTETQSLPSPVVLQLLQGEDVLVEVLLELLICIVNVKLLKPIHLQESRNKSGNTCPPLPSLSKIFLQGPCGRENAHGKMSRACLGSGDRI